MSDKALLPPLAQALVRRVFAAYLGVAILLTGLHVFVEYRATYDRMLGQFDTVAHAFEPTVSVALWTYQDDVLQSVAKGFLEERAILGVSIHELSGKELISVGQAKGVASAQDISRAYPIFAPGSGGRNLIGSLRIRSNHAVVASQVQAAVIFLLISAALKTVALWLIIRHFANQLLAKPLLRFAQQINTAKGAGCIDTQGLDLGPVPTDELGSLASAMDQLIAKVIAHEQLLQQLAKALEHRASSSEEKKIFIDGLQDIDPAGAAFKLEGYLAMREAFPEVLVWVTLWDLTVVHSPATVTSALQHSSLDGVQRDPATNEPTGLLDFVGPADKSALQCMLDQVRKTGEAECAATLTLHDERLVRCRFIARTVTKGDLSFIVVLSFDQLKYRLPQHIACDAT